MTGDPKPKPDAFDAALNEAINAAMDAATAITISAANDHLTVCIAARTQLRALYDDAPPPRRGERMKMTPVLLALLLACSPDMAVRDVPVCLDHLRTNPDTTRLALQEMTMVPYRHGWSPSDPALLAFRPEPIRVNCSRLYRDLLLYERQRTATDSTP